MNVLDFFELTSEPFANSPDGRFYFESAQHAQAMARLRYAVDSMKGLALVIGDVGAGKTTLARRFVETLPEEEYEAALLVVIHSAITSDWLLTKIAMQLGVEEPAGDKVTLLGQLYGRLREIHEAGKRAVVLIDEAQMLNSKEIMEEMRGLLNLELPGRKLVCLVFFGLPEIEASLRLDPPLQQRVAMKIHLPALPPSTTEEYIRHRLRIAGARTMFFSREAVAAVHRYSRGVPRLINTICDNAMLEAYLLKRKAIDKDLVASVARDLGLAEPPAADTRLAAAGGPQPAASRDPFDPRPGAALRPSPAAGPALQAARPLAPSVAAPASGPPPTPRPPVAAPPPGAAPRPVTPAVPPAAAAGRPAAAPAGPIAPAAGAAPAAPRPAAAPGTRVPAHGRGPQAAGGQEGQQRVLRGSPAVSGAPVQPGAARGAPGAEGAPAGSPSRPTAPGGPLTPLAGGAAPASGAAGAAPAAPQAGSALDELDEFDELLASLQKP